MISIRLPSIFLFSAFLFATLPANADYTPGTVYGLVTGTTDGGHLTVNGNGTEIPVKLYCVEAPVMTKVRKDRPWLAKSGQPFAGRAFMALSNKVLHKQVRIDILKIDRKRRAVAIVYLDGRNINLEMVAEGWGWASRKCQKRPPDAEYVAAEERARARKAGLWAQDNPQPPWEFKRMQKQEPK